nr:MAG TPA: hypothetical protein [Crassvirales sp.]
MAYRATPLHYCMLLHTLSHLKYNSLLITKIPVRE